MKNTFLLAACAAALLPAATVAADRAADPQAPVAPSAYRSAFEGTPRGIVEGTEDWKQAIDTVGKFPRGHIDLLKWEQAHPAVAAPPSPSAPASAPAPAARPGASGHQH